MRNNIHNNTKQNKIVCILYAIYCTYCPENETHLKIKSETMNIHSIHVEYILPRQQYYSALHFKHKQLKTLLFWLLWQPTILYIKCMYMIYNFQVTYIMCICPRATAVTMHLLGMHNWCVCCGFGMPMRQILCCMFRYHLLRPTFA